MNATELAQDIFGCWGTLEPEPTAAPLDSVRRAIRHLAARGVIVENFRARSYWQLAQPDLRERRQPRRHDPSESAEVELADRFVKLLGLLSSDHAGERANAVARSSGCDSASALAGATLSGKESPSQIDATSAVTTADAPLGGARARRSPSDFASSTLLQRRMIAISLAARPRRVWLSTRLPSCT
jgi:hypothetical protein